MGRALRWGDDIAPMRRLPLVVTLLALLATPSVAIADPFDQCLNRLRVSKSGRRLSSATWAHVLGTRPDTTVLVQLNAQPEFRLPIWDYLAVMVDEERIADGRRLFEQYRTVFDTVSRRYGVDAYTVAAVWGVESNFGRGVGTYSVLRSLATLSCAGRRQTYFRGELFAALRIVQAGHIRADEFRGSWAGAFGQTQFMPGVFWGRAVDFDGDGRRDLMTNTGDALASAANYLRLAGWRTGRPWGIEVRLPPADSAIGRGAGRRVRHPLRDWAARGLVRADSTPLIREGADSSLEAGLFIPSGPTGPVWLVTANFEAVYRYNAAESYTLAILHLADRLRGDPAIVVPWPTDDPGLSRAERRELQTLLAGRGHPIGVIDGLLSQATRAAVRVEQARLGQAVTGRPGQQLLARLRGR